jgi:hypothetical protein
VNERTTFIDFREKAALVNATLRLLINNQNSAKA